MSQEPEFRLDDLSGAATRAEAFAPAQRLYETAGFRRCELGEVRRVEGVEVVAANPGEEPDLE